MGKKYNLVRVTTVPVSMGKLLTGQMRYMKNQGFDVTMVSSDFAGKHELENREQSKYMVVNMTRKISPFSDFISLIRMISVILQLKPNIVHTHTPKAGLIGMLASWICRVPIRLHTVAGLPLMESHGIKRSLLNFVERLTYLFATKIYPNSTNLKKFIIEQNFCSADKLMVIGNGSSNGINTQEFRRSLKIDNAADGIRGANGIDADDFVFIFVGRLVRDKGVEELVHAFSILNKQHQNLKLLLVGPMEDDLDPLSPKCLENIDSNDAIISVGYQSDVRPYLSLSQVLVFPSYREGFPNVPMQAGCFDLPSIVTNINGCNEIIIDRENGIIVPVKSLVALKDAMEEIYLDKVLYRRMASNARPMIVNRYEQEIVWALILDEYKKQLKVHEIIQ